MSRRWCSGGGRKSYPCGHGRWRSRWSDVEVRLQLGWCRVEGQLRHGACASNTEAGCIWILGSASRTKHRSLPATAIKAYQSGIAVIAKNFNGVRTIHGFTAVESRLRQSMRKGAHRGIAALRRKERPHSSFGLMKERLTMAVSRAKP